jgi:hypothetical protein
MPIHAKFVRLSEQIEVVPELQEKEQAHRQVIGELLGNLREDESITHEEYHKLSTFVADLNLDEFFALCGCFGACFLHDFQEQEPEFVGMITIDLGGLIDGFSPNAHTND